MDSLQKLHFDDATLKALGRGVQIILGAEYILRLPEGEIIPVHADELLKTHRDANLRNNQQMKVALNQWWKTFSSFLIPEAEAARADTLSELFIKRINETSVKPAFETYQLWQQSGKEIKR